ASAPRQVNRAIPTDFRWSSLMPPSNASCMPPHLRRTNTTRKWDYFVESLRFLWDGSCGRYDFELWLMATLKLGCAPSFVFGQAEACARQALSLRTVSAEHTL